MATARLVPPNTRALHSARQVCPANRTGCLVAKAGRRCGYALTTRTSRWAARLTHSSLRFPRIAYLRQMPSLSPSSTSTPLPRPPSSKTMPQLTRSCLSLARSFRLLGASACNNEVANFPQPKLSALWPRAYRKAAARARPANDAKHATCRDAASRSSRGRWMTMRHT